MSNEKKSIRLEMPYHRARVILHKSILFDLVKKCGLDNCYRCNKKIENIDELSVEHKEAWLNSDNPKKLFFDLNNIAFSHLSCNSKAGDREWSKDEEFKSKVSFNNSGEKNFFAKLTEKQVAEIRYKLTGAVGIYSLRSLAKEYNVSHSTIISIRDNETWQIISPSCVTQ